MPGPGPTSPREPEPAPTTGPTPPRKPQKAASSGNGPGHPFGPESVPSATGSATVVYWVPGPIRGPVGLRSDLPLIAAMSTIPPPPGPSAPAAAARWSPPRDLFPLVGRRYD